MSSATENNLALQRAIDVAKLPGSLLRRVQRPDAVIRYHVPYQRDDGETHWVEGYRVQHSRARGVYKGGLRFHPGVNEGEVKELAFLMALKTAVCDAPAGGGKGGLVVDPKKLSESELERLSKAFGARLAVHIGPDRDVPAGDVGTPPKVMRWLLEGGQLPPASITSKPVEDGGDPFRDASTGFGTALCVRRHEERLGRALEGQRVVIQGFGNVGSWCARTLQGWGARIIGISNSRLSIHDGAGFSADALVELADRMPRDEKSASKYGRVAGPEEALTTACEILAPCAVGGAINASNVDKVDARVIVEGANGPVTQEADAVLEGRGVPVLPGVLANGGGVCCSMYEWEANKANRSIADDESRPRLEEQLGRAFDRVAAVQESHGLSFRVAAYMVAVQVLAEAEA
ncbi:MAG: Glu/Leu/Phe/Val dehydrogenase [Myxococcota bacterium]